MSDIKIELSEKELELLAETLHDAAWGIRSSVYGSRPDIISRSSYSKRQLETAKRIDEIVHKLDAARDNKQSNVSC